MRNVIYAIKDLITGSAYIGGTTNSRKRFWEHRRDLRAGEHHCKDLQKAWSKYGEDYFKFEILEQVENPIELRSREQLFLDEALNMGKCYNTAVDTVRPMNNIDPKVIEQLSNSLKSYYSDNAHPRLGTRHTKESRELMSRNRKGLHAGEKHYRYGKTVSDEVKKKIGDAQRGKPKPVGRKVSPEGIAKIKADYAAGRRVGSFKGKSHTEESKLKISKKVLAMPDNITFNSLTATLQHYGLKMPTLRRALKTGKPIAKGRLAGYSFSYLN